MNRLRAALIAIVLAALFVGAIAVLESNSRSLRGPIARTVGAHLKHPVQIDGIEDLHLLSLHPHGIFTGVTVGNPKWAGAGDFVRIGRVSVELSLLPLLHGALVLPRVDAQDTQIHLLRDASGRGNWRIGSGDGFPSRGPARLPRVGSFNLKSAQVEFVDELRKLTAKGIASADETAANGGPNWLRVKGAGVADGQPFSIAAIGQSLVDVRSGRPYLLNADIHALGTHLQGKVSIDEPFDLGMSATDFEASGSDLADLYHLTRIVLPNTAPYRLSARLRREDTQYHLSAIAGQIGSSDLHGTLSVDMKTADPRQNVRPSMTADLTSRAFNIADLRPALGSRTAPRRGTEDRFFPEARLDPQRVRKMDAVVQFHAESVQTRKIPLRQMSFQLHLEHGVMTIDPVSFGFAQGRVTGKVRIDATHDDPDVSLDARIADVSLSQFHSKNGASPIDGVLAGRAVLHGHGRSVREAVATADGSVTAVVPHGEIREAFAELAGMDAVRGLGLLLAKDQEKTDVRCGIAQFQAVKGTLMVQTLIFDTDNVLITGKGQVDLGSEQWDLSLRGEPKKMSLRIKSSLALRGTFLQPSISVKSGNAFGQSGLAIGLAAVLTPVAAILPFVDPGLAKDANCSALLQEAEQAGHTQAQHRDSGT